MDEPQTTKEDEWHHGRCLKSTLQLQAFEKKEKKVSAQRINIVPLRLNSMSLFSKKESDSN